MNKSVTHQKSKAFAVRIIRFYKYLTEEKHEYVLAKQILRSGTSIGAMFVKVTLHKAKLILSVSYTSH